MNQFQLLHEAEKIAHRASVQTQSSEAMNSLSNLARTFGRLAEVRALIGEDPGGETRDLPAEVIDAHGRQWTNLHWDMYARRDEGEMDLKLELSMDELRAKHGPISKRVAGGGLVVVS